MDFGSFLSAWASSMGAPQQQPPRVELPDYMAGINEAFAANEALGAEKKKQAAIKSAVGGMATDLAKWQQGQEADRARFAKEAAAAQAAHEATFAQEQQAHAARLNMPRRPPPPIIGFGLPPHPSFSRRGY